MASQMPPAALPAQETQTREPVDLDSSQQPRDDSVFSQLDVADTFIDIGDQPTPSQNLNTGMASGLLERACSVLGSPGLLERSGSTGAVAGTPSRRPRHTYDTGSWR